MLLPVLISSSTTTAGVGTRELSETTTDIGTSPKLSTSFLSLASSLIPLCLSDLVIALTTFVNSNLDIASASLFTLPGLYIISIYPDGEYCSKYNIHLPNLPVSSSTVTFLICTNG